MKSSCRKRGLVFGAVFGSIACAMLGLASQAGAQQADAPPVNQSDSVRATMTENAGSATDEKLGERVRDALHSDPYFYDEHVTVSVEKGAVVLRGFVSSEWDLRDAIRIANRAAGGRRVIDDLSIKLGGSR
jgi:osmotically-inducible protein OsmY